jgi:LPS export ABC transporter protein LptC
MSRAGLLASVVATVLSAAACRGEETTIPTGGAGLGDSADQISSTVRMRLVTEGIQQANLTADSAYFFDQMTRIELREIEIEFFSETGTATGTLTAREGTYRRNGEQMEARGDVVLVGTDGRRLTTEQLRYDQRRNEISSDSAWVMTQPNGDRGQGVGFVTDPQLTTFKCSNCSGVFRTPPAAAATPPPG